MAQAGGPPPLGLHVVMGPDAATKAGNMSANIEAGVIAPVEIVTPERGGLARPRVVLDPALEEGDPLRHRVREREDHDHEGPELLEQEVLQ